MGSEPVEDSGVFRNKEARSVFGVVIILPPQYSKTAVYFDFVSTVLNHDARFAIDCLRKIFSSQSPRHIPPAIKKVEIWSDCGMHFRCAQFLTFVMWVILAFLGCH